ncbi:MAG: DUF1801 domain-containing protein [Gemmatimonadaceae bacterium]
MANTIDEYIAEFPKNVQRILTDLRARIRTGAPDATERIAYGMPTFYLNGNLVHFAAFERHIGFYPTPSGIVAFADQLKRYATSKGAVQFPIDEPLPFALISEMVAFRVQENASKGSKPAKAANVDKPAPAKADMPGTTSKGAKAMAKRGASTKGTKATAKRGASTKGTKATAKRGASTKGAKATAKRRGGKGAA